ncbi:MAG: type IVB secretion system protein IcmV [Legionellales bacterium]|nr:type IVB secretion system protein IcmV [Legionellales bacterium]
MGFWRGFGRVVKPFVDVPRWLDYRGIADNTKYIARAAKNLFSIQKSSRRETFDQAVRRLGLTDEMLHSQMQSLYRLAHVYFVLALIVLGYAIYLFISLAFFSGLLAVVISAYMLANAFRARFRYFQIKTRRLGQSFREWFSADIQGKTYE